MTFRATRFTTISSLVLLLAAAPPPKTPLPHAGEVIDVSIVNVDVFVTDKHGKRVRGLTADDFEIVEDRRPQPITNFAEYTPEPVTDRASVEAPAAAAPEAPAPATAAPAKPQPRTVIVYVEHYWLPDFRNEQIFAPLKELLHKTIRPGDQAMIVSWRHGLRTRQAMTDDLGALDRAIDAIAKENTGAYFDGADQMRRENEELQRWMDEVKDAAAGKGFNVSGEGFDVSKEVGRDSARIALQELKGKVSALNALMSNTSGLEGKKVLLMAAHRFSLTAGLEYLLPGRNGPFLEGADRNEFDTRKIIDSLVATANANNVTIYPLYPEGLETRMNTAEVEPIRIGIGSGGGNFSNIDNLRGSEYEILNNELPALDRVAKQTGGVLGWGPDIAKLLPQVQDDFDSYYSLGYRATNRGQDSARKIVVKTKNPAYTVRSRREYVEKSDTTRMKERVVANLFQPPGGTTMSIQAEVGPYSKKAPGECIVPLRIRIPVASLMTTPDAKNNGAFSVFVAWGNVLGRISDVTHRTQPFTVADVKSADGAYFLYELQVRMDGMTDKLSVGVLDEVSKDYGLQRIELTGPKG